MSALLRGAGLPPGVVLALVQGLLQVLPAEATGSESWWDQRRALERLNSAAHAEGEGVVGAALALCPEALDALVRTLLAAEAWRERVADRLGASLPQSPLRTRRLRGAPPGSSGGGRAPPLPLPGALPRGRGCQPAGGGAAVRPGVRGGQRGGAVRGCGLRRALGARRAAWSGPCRSTHTPPGGAR